MTPTPRLSAALALLVGLAAIPAAGAQTPFPTTPPDFRGQINAERQGLHDANRIRTQFYNYGMVGDYVGDADLSVTYSVEVPRGIGLNYSDGITPYVLARITQENGQQAYVMLTGFRERQARSPLTNRVMRFEPRPGYVETDPEINEGTAVAISNDFRTWPGAANLNEQFDPATDPAECWYDKRDDPDDPGWCGSWNGFFGKRPNADQESFFVMDDNYYDAFAFYPDSRDRTRRGLGLRVEVRGFQWSNPQAQDVIFWHYDIVNESTTEYDDIIFGLYMDSGVGGSAISCDGTAESDDDNARFIRNLNGRDLDLVYTWDENGHGVSLRSNCEETGYLGYAYLETPGDATDNVDNDNDGITDERRDNEAGDPIVGQDAIRAAMLARGYDLAQFEIEYGPLEQRPAYVAGVWFPGDEDLDWTAEFSDTGADGVYADDRTFGSGTPDTGENDGRPTDGEPNFDRTDITESDQIGLTGFKLNRIRGAGETDGIVFFQNGSAGRSGSTTSSRTRTRTSPSTRPSSTTTTSGSSSPPGRSRSRSAGASGSASRSPTGPTSRAPENVEVVQSIYDANYQFATPPPLPTVRPSPRTAGSRSSGTPRRARDRPGHEPQRLRGLPGLPLDGPQLPRPAGHPRGRGTGPIGNGRAHRAVRPRQRRQGVLRPRRGGASTTSGRHGIRHTFMDTDVVNGQTYYYAVTSYDRARRPQLLPSENSIAVSPDAPRRDDPPANVVQVRPNARVPGYVGATASEPERVSGDGRDRRGRRQRAELGRRPGGAASGSSSRAGRQRGRPDVLARRPRHGRAPVRGRRRLRGRPDGPVAAGVARRGHAGRRHARPRRSGYTSGSSGTASRAPTSARSRRTSSARGTPRTSCSSSPTRR